MDEAAWEKAKDLVADALELPAAERDAFVTARCSDGALLAEILALLKGYAEAPDFLESQGGDPDADSNDLAPGTQIGPYVVLHLLGRGGMGQVYLASDRRLKRKVALKRLLPSRLGSDEARGRLLREARAAARISHPNVATIHDVIEHGTHVFIVMEYVGGESLADRLLRGPLPPAEVVAIGRQLAAALVAAHASGVIHRDLKPANVQVMPDGTAKVLDFGIAQPSHPVTTFSSPLSGRRVEGVGIRAGTPGYMSPEQLSGGRIDERSDIFSLGVVLFEMAAGRRPFAPTAFLDPATTIRTAPRLDAVEPRLPRGLADLVARTLQVEPGERFRSAPELYAALNVLQQELNSWTVLPPGPQPVPWPFGLKIALAVIATPYVLALFGLFNTFAFNYALQRPARFASEPWYAYVDYGFRSNFGLLVFAVGVGVLAAAAAFVLRVLSRLPPIGRLIDSGRARFLTLVGRLDLADPTVFGQCVALLGLIAFAAVAWWHSSLIAAHLQFVTLATPEQLLLLSPASEYGMQRFLYRTSVNLLVLWFAFGLAGVARLRARATPRRGTGALTVLGAMLVLIAAFHQVPYRLMFQNQFERTDVAGARCYLLGEDGDEAFVFCPETRPPSTRVIRLDDPGVRRLGVIESIFTPPFEQAASSSQSSP